MRDMTTVEHHDWLLSRGWLPPNSVAAIRAEERERCAQVADGLARYWKNIDGRVANVRWDQSAAIADQIRKLK